MYRRAIAAFAALCLLASAAFALTPGQRAALFGGGGIPAWVLQGAGASATFDFDFANGRYYQQGRGRNLAALINVSRASAGAAVSSTGVWTQFPNNTPRITNLGLLREEARTNGIRNNSMQGATITPSHVPTNWGIGAAGTVSTVVGLGTENGIDYIDLNIAGTPTGVQYVISFETSTTIAAAQGQAWIDSVFLALLPGGTGLTNISSIKPAFNENNNAGGFLVAHNGSDVKGSLPASLNTSSRFSLSATTSNASTAFVISSVLLGFTIGQAVNVNLRFGWPQIEQGAFVTSPIRTTTVALTRAADVVTLASLPQFGSAWSFYVNGTLSEVSAVRSLLGTSAANNQPIYSPSSNTLADANNGSVALAATTGSGGWTTGAKAAAGFSAAGRSIVMNNGTVATDANTHIAPTTLYIGGSAGTVAGSGTISRVAGWASTRLGDTTLQALTQ